MYNRIDYQIDQLIIYEFENILKKELVNTYFQSIVNLQTGGVIGYEATSRGPEGSKLFSPLTLLSLADQLNKGWELELLFRTKALEKAQNLHKDKLLFINVDPKIMNDPNFKKGFTKEYIKQMDLKPSSIVFEITERTAIEDYKSFTNILNHYKNQGYNIAIDDMGAGYSGLKTLNETRPRFIKMDMDLIRDIDKDDFKYALIKAFVDLSKATQFQVIAEGIETKEELMTLIELGVHGGQGYYLQRPMLSMKDIHHSVREEIQSYNYTQSLKEMGQYLS
ncbi:EAL domain-containing protein [Vallitalea okinawensis]|uniref:EAL domain-containing protein n=1 Tax=Vallitalea okinawensis TaxID=2078660 RepID=UPI000CFBEF83|nr:EAL domain-containing protein [Vallitalea okinawensis]